MTWTQDAYFHAALDAELGHLRNTPLGGRACAAFRAAAALGGFVASGAIAREEAERLLLDAALDTGLPEREASSHIRRGLNCGQRTPRDLPREGAGKPCPHLPYRLSVGGEQCHARPPSTEVDALWSASSPVDSDSVAVEWFRRRYGGHARSFLEQSQAHDLARVIPSGLSLPRWAWSRRGPWARTGHRLLFRLWDCAGSALSLRARCLYTSTTPKSLAPCGFSVRSLVLADPIAIQLLAGDAKARCESLNVVIAEGEPDWLLWSAGPRDTEARCRACFGVEAGAWCQQIADRIPDGIRVSIRTHHDQPGDRYARQVMSTLRGRCRVFRSKREDGVRG